MGVTTKDTPIFSPTFMLDCCCYSYHLPPELVVIIRRYFIIQYLDNNSIREAVSLWCSTQTDCQTDCSSVPSPKTLCLLKFGDISLWNTTNVTDMNRLFYNKPTFNDDIHYWDTCNVSDMRGMFCAATLFNQPIGS